MAISTGAALLGGAGLSFLGGAMSADAASDAAAGQERAAREAAGEQRRQFDLLRQDSSPFLQTGQMANMRLREMLGLGGGSSTPTRSVEQIMAELRNSGRFSTAGQGLQRGQAVEGEGGIVGYRFFDPSDPFSYDRLEQNEYRMGPATVDEEALKAEAQKLYEQGLSSGTPGNVGELLRSFSGSDLANEPGYQFRLNEGNKSIENAARARGMYSAPSTVKELLRYNQDYASNEYGNAFNRNIADRSTKYNFLTGTSGGGQQAAQTVGNAGMGMATNVGQLINGAANARGAAGIAGANAWNDAFSNVGGTYNQYRNRNMQQQMMERMFPQSYNGSAAPF